MIAHAEKRALRRELDREGAFAPRTVVTSVKFLAMVSALAALLAAVVLSPIWAAALLVPLAAIPTVTAAMIGHEAAHGSFARNKLHNEIMLHIAFPLFTGLGGLHWKNKHNRLHHSHPNVPGTDEDIDLWPMATTREEHARAGRFRGWLQRSLQGYLFWPLTLFLGFVMRLESIMHLVRRARGQTLDGKRVDRAWWLDAGCIAGHYVLWLVVPSLWFGVVPVVLLYVGLWSVVGLMLAMVFTPAHMGLPFVRGHDDKWLHQLETTRNLRLPRWLSWFFVGLDYQVEHHLFPNIPHQNMPLASGIVRRWCERNGAPYQEIGYAAGLVEVTRFMFSSWRYDFEAAGAEAAGAEAAGRDAA